MLSSRTIAALASTFSLTFALPRPVGNDATTLQDERLWQSSGSDNSAAQWFYQFQDSMAIMQGESFWSGYDWKDSIQWTSAVLNTLLGATDRSLTEILVANDGGTIPGSYISGSTIEGEISKYNTQMQSFFDSEDTVQIFDAAYDDAQWVILEWLEAIKYINEHNAYTNNTLGQNDDIRKLAHRAHVFYNIVQNEFDESTCNGGVTWNPALEPYKNAITNELFMASSIAMYLHFPGDYNTDPYPSFNYSTETNTTLPPLTFMQPHDPVFLDNAIKEHAWFKSQNFTNEQGLIVDGFHISANQTSCDQRNEMVYSYNQGVILSGLRGLWEATGDPEYLSEGYNHINTVIAATGWNALSEEEASQWSGLGRNGIMEDYCDAAANCSQDAQIFKGIYFHHLSAFCEPLPVDVPLVEGVTVLADEELSVGHAANCDGYITWVEHNAHAALESRNADNVVGGWWGANYSNSSSGSDVLSDTADVAVPVPQGSWDMRNHPEDTREAPWACRGGRGCSQNRRGRGRGPRKPWGQWNQWKRDVNEGGRGRTVETQGSGVAVVKAASDFTRTRSVK